MLVRSSNGEKKLFALLGHIQTSHCVTAFLKKKKKFQRCHCKWISCETSINTVKDLAHAAVLHLAHLHASRFVPFPRACFFLFVTLLVREIYFNVCHLLLTFLCFILLQNTVLFIRMWMKICEKFVKVYTRITEKGQYQHLMHY